MRIRWRRPGGAAGGSQASAGEQVFPGGRILIGEVTAFDPDSGLGAVVLEGFGTTPVRFHCIAVDDGSRAVGVGRRVACRLGASYGGEVEVVTLRKL